LAIAADHPIRQLTPVPPRGCRLLVHFEGWTEKWDEFLVLPTKASRFCNLIRGDTGRRVHDPSCFISEVAGLHLRDVGAAAAAARDDGGVGETQHVAVVGVWFPKESCSFPCTSAPIPTPTLATAPHTATTTATGATISRDMVSSFARRNGCIPMARSLRLDTKEETARVHTPIPTCLSV